MDAAPLSDEILSSRAIKIAQNALFVETHVRHFEANANLETCPAFYEYVVGLGKPGVQIMTYTKRFSDMCDEGTEKGMPLPAMPSAKGLYHVNQLVTKRQALCPNDTTSDNMTNLFGQLFDQVQVYHGMEMASLQSNFVKMHRSCKAVGEKGGQEAPVGAYSHTVNLRHTATGQSFCGGILFSRTHVLTAAHCLTNADEEKVQYVSVGGHYSKGESEGSEEIVVKNAVPHPLYNATTAKNDIMILELGKSSLS